MPTITRDLGSEVSVWIGAAFQIPGLAFTPWAGLLANTYGRRPALLMYLAVFAVGNLVCALARSLAQLLIGRVLLGIGAGGLYSVPTIIITDLVPLSQRGLYGGITIAGSGLAACLAPILGGIFVETDWRLLFWLGLGVTLFTGGLAIFVDVKTPPVKVRAQLGRLDFRGNALFVASVTSFALALSWAGVTYSWTSFHVLLPLFLGVAGVAAFVLYERTLEHPTIPFAALQNRTACAGVDLGPSAPC